MKTVFSLFLLVGMSPGSFLPSYLIDQLLAPVVDQEAKASEPSGEANPPPPGDPGRPEPGQVAASSYAATRSTSLQVAKDQIRAIFTLKIQPAASFEPCAVNPVRQDNSIRASLLESEIRIAREPSVGLPSLRAQAPPFPS